MNRGIFIVILALGLGVAGYSLVRWKQHAGHQYGHDYALHSADGNHPELDWLREELEVTEEQMGKIKALHVAYHPVCENLTRRLEDSHRKLENLTARATSVGDEMDEALRDHAAVHLDCQRAMLRHLYDTAACLPSDKARRYLDKMLPFVFLHDSATDEHAH